MRTIIKTINIFIISLLINCIGCNVTKTGENEKKYQDKFFKASLDCILKHQRMLIRDYLKPVDGSSLFVSCKINADSQEKDLEIVFFNKAQNKALLYEVMITEKDELLFRNYGFCIKDNDKWIINYKPDEVSGQRFMSQGGIGTLNEILENVTAVTAMDNPEQIIWHSKDDNLEQIPNHSICP